MARPKSVIRTVDIHILMPEEDAGRMELHLYSPAEQRVPYAAKQKFLVGLVREFFSRRTFDLSQVADVPPGTVVYGPASTIEILQDLLRRVHV